MGEDKECVCAVPKLFLGQMPPDVTKDDVWALFKNYGTILRVDMLQTRDGRHRGCAMVWFERWADAERALEGEANNLPFGGDRTLVVKFADPPRRGDSQTGIKAKKVFVGQVPRDATESDVRALFEPFGTIVDFQMPRRKTVAGCAFVKFAKWAQAEAAIEALNGQNKIPGSTRPLVVKFADAKPQQEPQSNVGDKRRLNQEGLQTYAKRSIQRGMEMAMGMGMMNGMGRGPLSRVQQLGMGMGMGVGLGSMVDAMAMGPISSMGGRNIAGAGKGAVSDMNAMSMGPVTPLEMSGGLGGSMDRSGVSRAYVQEEYGMQPNACRNGGASGVKGGFLGNANANVLNGSSYSAMAGGELPGGGSFLGHSHLRSSMMSRRTSSLANAIPGINTDDASQAHGMNASDTLEEMNNSGFGALAGGAMMGVNVGMGSMRMMGNGGIASQMDFIGGVPGGVGLGGVNQKMGLNNGQQMMQPPVLGPNQSLGPGIDDKAAEQWKLFVGQIPKAADEYDLWNLFTSIGKVLELKILRKKGQSCGCGFVTYATQDLAQEAIRSLNGQSLPWDPDQRKLVVHYRAK